MGDWLFHFLASYQGCKSNFLCHFYGICCLLIALVTYGGPTPGNYYMHDVVPPNGGIWGSSWQRQCKTRYSPIVGISFALYLLGFEEVFAVFLGFTYLDAEYW